MVHCKYKSVSLCVQLLMLAILSQVHLLKQQGSRVIPGTDTLDAGLGKQTTSGVMLMYST